MDDNDNLFIFGHTEQPFDADLSTGETLIGEVNQFQSYHLKYDSTNNLVFHLIFQNLPLTSGQRQIEIEDMDTDASGNLFLIGQAFQSAAPYALDIDFRPDSYVQTIPSDTNDLNAFHLMMLKLDGTNGALLAHFCSRLRAYSTYVLGPDRYLS